MHRSDSDFISKAYCALVGRWIFFKLHIKVNLIAIALEDGCASLISLRLFTTAFNVVWTNQTVLQIREEDFNAYSVNRDSLYSKMATCADPSDDPHYPIRNPSHIRPRSHRHAGNTVCWIFMTTCHILDACPTTDSQSESDSPVWDGPGCVCGVQIFLWVLLHPKISLAHLACGVKLIFVQTRELNGYYLD